MKFGYSGYYHYHHPSGHCADLGVVWYSLDYYRHPSCGALVNGTITLGCSDICFVVVVLVPLCLACMTLHLSLICLYSALTVRSPCK